MQNLKNKKELGIACTIGFLIGGLIGYICRSYTSKSEIRLKEKIQLQNDNEQLMTSKNEQQQNLTKMKQELQIKDMFLYQIIPNQKNGLEILKKNIENIQRQLQLSEESINQLMKQLDGNNLQNQQVHQIS